MKSYVIYTALAVLALVAPTAADAYEVKSHQTWQVNETTTLYAIEFSFGHGTHDFYIPTSTSRNQAWGTDNKTVGYEILEDSQTVSNDGASIGMITSNAELSSDGLYYIPKGAKETFTLYVALTLPANAPEADYAMAVSDLPFYRNDDREYLRLNPSELNYYQTDEVEFNSSNPSK